MWAQLVCSRAGNSAIWKRSTKPNLFGWKCTSSSNAFEPLLWVNIAYVAQTFTAMWSIHANAWWVDVTWAYVGETNKQTSKQTNKVANRTKPPNKQEYHQQQQQKQKQNSNKILLWRSAHWDDVLHHKLTTKTSCRSTHVGPGRRVAEYRPLFGQKAGAGAAVGPVVQLAGAAGPLEVEGQTLGPSLAHLGTCFQTIGAER